MRKLTHPSPLVTPPGSASSDTDSMREKGFRLKTIRVLDTRRPGFAEECRRQSLLLAKSSAERRYLDDLVLPEVEGWELRTCGSA